MNAKQQILTAMAIAETVRSLNEVPAGHLYAQLMDRMTLAEFQSTIEVLKRAGLIKQVNWLITWIGPEVKES